MLRFISTCYWVTISSIILATDRWNANTSLLESSSNNPCFQNPSFANAFVFSKINRSFRQNKYHQTQHKLFSIPHDSNHDNANRRQFRPLFSTIEQETATTATKNGDDPKEQQSNDDLNAWEILAGNLATCLIASDQKRATGMDGGSTGWTSWIEESSSFKLQQCVDRLGLAINTSSGGDDTEISNNNNSHRDATLRWLAWIKNTPSPIIVELSDEFRSTVDSLLTPKDWERARVTDAQSKADFLSRIGCRLVVLPSGESLRSNIQTPPGAMVYGKLLLGGVTRYRLLGGRTPRRAGERTTIMPLPTKEQPLASSKGWLQYGGPDRNYEAVDMGPCAVLEITILPKDLKLGLLVSKQTLELEEEALPAKTEGSDENTNDDDETVAVIPIERQPTEEMIVSKVANFDPQWLFALAPDVNTTITSANETSAGNAQEESSSIDNDNYASVEEIERRFSSVLGGLRPEIRSIIRRVLDGRQKSSNNNSELQTMLDFGLSPIRGLLLYGPPGSGKTAMAREISKLLTDRPTKIVAAPELLDRWVGGTESLVRNLFGDAEDELKVCGGDVTKSGLHVIVIDEIDAVFRQRSSSSGSGEVARASAVNQILAKLDGVQALGNILVIGTTNRRELLDDALLRPGRLEVKIEVKLPDREGRREILQIHFGPLRSLGRLSQPLCRAIDGGNSKEGRIRRSSFLADLRGKKDRASVTIRDLAADRWTGGFSGADIEGLVRCAGSIALSRARVDGSGVDGLLITTEDVAQAIRELKQ